MAAFRMMSALVLVSLAAVAQAAAAQNAKVKSVLLGRLNAHLEPKDAVEVLFDLTDRSETGGRQPPAVPPSPDASRLFLVPSKGVGVMTTSEAYCVARQRIQKTKEPADPNVRVFVSQYLALPLCIEVPTTRLLQQNIQASFDRAEKEFYLKRSYALEAEIRVLTQQVEQLQVALGARPPARAASGGRK